MDFVVCLLLAGSVTGLAVAAPAWSVAALASGCVAMGALRVRKGRWQLAPAVVTASLCLAVVAAAGAGPPAWAVISLALLAAPAVAIVYWSPIPHLPVPSGPHAVGLTVADRDKAAQLHIWYPATGNSNDNRRYVFSNEEARAYSHALRALGGPGFLYQHFRLARRHSEDGAIPGSGRYPLVVFNHGGAMWPTQNSALMEDLASHGFVVVSLAHPGESASVSWADGSETPLDPEVIGAMNMAGQAVTDHANFLVCRRWQGRRALFDKLEPHYRPTLGQATRRWAKRSVETVDWLLDGNGGDELGAVVAAIDRRKVAYCGMSLGGSVAHECCYLDSRATAGVNLDGMNWSFDRADSSVPTPFLQVYSDPGTVVRTARRKADIECDDGDEDLTARTLQFNDYYYERPSTRGAREDVIRVTLKGAAHMTFTDQALAARGPMRRIVGTGEIDGRQASAAINSLVRDFLGAAFGGGGVADVAAAPHRHPCFVRQRLGPDF